MLFLPSGLLLGCLNTHCLEDIPVPASCTEWPKFLEPKTYTYYCRRQVATHLGWRERRESVSEYGLKMINRALRIFVWPDPLPANTFIHTSQVGIRKSFAAANDKDNGLHPALLEVEGCRKVDARPASPLNNNQPRITSHDLAWESPISSISPTDLLLSPNSEET